MKSNFENLESFVDELDRIDKSAEDYVTPAGIVVMQGDSRLQFSDDVYDVNDHAHGQIAEKLGIPRSYYQAIGNIEGLRSYNVNELLMAREKEDKKYLIRTIDGTVRAFLSDRYKPINNLTIVKQLLPALAEHGDNVKIHANSLTERNMYLQFRFPRMRAEVTPGDIVEGGVMITNSEVGAGAFVVRGFLYRLVCRNGMVLPQVINERHIGSRLVNDGQIVFADDTINADRVAYEKQLRDTFAWMVSQTWIDEQIRPMRLAAEAKFDEGKLTEVVDAVAKRVDLREAESSMVVRNVIRGTGDGGGKCTKWHLANAITALSHDIEDVDRQVDMEEAGYKVVNMSESEWKKLVA